MDMYEQAQRQNLKVWARRMGVPITDGHYEYLADKMPGSVLKGPLAMVFSNRLRGTIEDTVVRFNAAYIAGRALADHIRNPQGGNLLSLLAGTCDSDDDKVIYTRYSTELVKLMSEAITARQNEKQRNENTLTEKILKKVR